jgi:hypothetical protein
MDFLDYNKEGIAENGRCSLININLSKTVIELLQPPYIHIIR